MSRCWETCPLCGFRCRLDGMPHSLHMCARPDCNMLSWMLRLSMPRDLPDSGALVTVIM